MTLLTTAEDDIIEMSHASRRVPEISKWRSTIRAWAGEFETSECCAKSRKASNSSPDVLFRSYLGRDHLDLEIKAVSRAILVVAPATPQKGTDKFLDISLMSWAPFA